MADDSSVPASPRPDHGAIDPRSLDRGAVEAPSQLARGAAVTFDMQLVDNRLSERVMRVKLEGSIRAEKMACWAEAYRRATDTYAGAAHVVVADLRGLKPPSKEAATILADAVAYGRTRGALLCIQISDESIARLQARRVAREASPGDEATIYVSSMAEAEKLLASLRPRLVTFRPPPGPAPREALYAGSARETGVSGEASVVATLRATISMHAM